MQCHRFLYFLVLHFDKRDIRGEEERRGTTERWRWTLDCLRKDLQVAFLLDRMIVGMWPKRCLKGYQMTRIMLFVARHTYWGSTFISATYGPKSRIDLRKVDTLFVIGTFHGELMKQVLRVKCEILVKSLEGCWAAWRWWGVNVFERTMQLRYGGFVSRNERNSFGSTKEWNIVLSWAFVRIRQYCDSATTIAVMTGSCNVQTPDEDEYACERKHQVLALFRKFGSNFSCKMFVNLIVQV